MKEAGRQAGFLSPPHGWRQRVKGGGRGRGSRLGTHRAAGHLPRGGAAAWPLGNYRAAAAEQGLCPRGL